MDIKDFLNFLHKKGVLSLNEKGGYVFAYHWKPEKVYTEEEARELVKGFHSLSSDEQEEFRFDNYDCSFFEAMVINSAILEGSSPETTDFLEVLIHKYLESCNVSPESLIHTATPEFYEDVFDAFWLNVGVDYNAKELFEKNGLSQYSFIQQMFEGEYQERKKELDVLFEDSLEIASSYLEEMGNLNKRLICLEFNDETVELMALNMFRKVEDPQMLSSIHEFLNDGWSALDIGVNITILPLFITKLDGDLANADGKLEWKVMQLDAEDETIYICTLTVFFDEEGVVTKLNFATRIVGE
jgi:hypothetical protein